MEKSCIIAPQTAITYAFVVIAARLSLDSLGQNEVPTFRPFSIDACHVRN